MTELSFLFVRDWEPYMISIKVRLHKLNYLMYVEFMQTEVKYIYIIVNYESLGLIHSVQHIYINSIMSSGFHDNSTVKIRWNVNTTIPLYITNQEK